MSGSTELFRCVHIHISINISGFVHLFFRVILRHFWQISMEIVIWNLASQSLVCNCSFFYGLMSTLGTETGSFWLHCRELLGIFYRVCQFDIFQICSKARQRIYLRTCGQNFGRCTVENTDRMHGTIQLLTVEMFRSSRNLTQG